MLEIDVACATLPQFSGKRVIQKNLVYIGSDHTCDIFTPGEGVRPIHVFIEIVGGKLLLHLDEKVEFVHLDRKLTTSVRYFKLGQVIKFADYEITVSNFLETSYPTARESINALTDQLLEGAGPDLEYLKSMQNYE